MKRRRDQHSIDQDIYGKTRQLDIEFFEKNNLFDLKYQFFIQDIKFNCSGSYGNMIKGNRIFSEKQHFNWNDFPKKGDFLINLDFSIILTTINEKESIIIFKDFIKNRQVVKLHLGWSYDYFLVSIPVSFQRENITLDNFIIRLNDNNFGKSKLVQGASIFKICNFEKFIMTNSHNFLRLLSSHKENNDIHTYINFSIILYCSDVKWKHWFKIWILREYFNIGIYPIEIFIFLIKNFYLF